MNVLFTFKDAEGLLMKRILSLFLLGFAGFLIFSAVAETPEKGEEVPEQKSESGRPSKETLIELQKAARERMRDDARYYSKEDREEIEKLYQSWQSKKGKEQDAIAVTLQRRFPKANRTGCAVLMMALNSSRSRQVKLLQQVIKDHGDCRYLNGVQVGALARYYLIIMLTQDAKKDEAQKYMDELKTSYPNAIDHSRILLSHLLSMKLAPYVNQ